MENCKILLVHGVGHKESDANWADDWKDAIVNGIRTWNPAMTVQFATVQYDDLFARSTVSAAVVAKAMTRLLTSGVVNGMGDLFTRSRDFSETLRWTAGMVAQWAADKNLRSAVRQAVKTAILESKPDVICAHSLGSLICYDLMAREQDQAANRVLVSFGSQIGNPFVRSLFGGRIVALTKAKKWFHLYNREDDVLTASIRLEAENFEQVTTFFDIPGYTDHDPKEYLSHPNTMDRVWRTVGIASKAAESRSQSFWIQAAKKPECRALLVGINDYPDPSNRLDGCVNDVFRMSRTLQQSGWKPEHIRTVLNERATARGIRDRLEWLLDDSGPGQVRLFYYSGHGAQIPNYGENDEVDHVDECLVPHDFDWSPERAVIDDQFYDLYSQLPYKTNFVAILDCCHSGGMTRSGAAKIRGLLPPDDIRHRALAFDDADKSWVLRRLTSPDKKFVRKKAEQAHFVGTSGSVKRLGRAVSLWSPQEADFRSSREAFRHHGPYLPVLLQACQEDEFSYEYRQGSESYGAFTYQLTAALASKKRLSFQKLVTAAAAGISKLGYRQTPVLVCPSIKRNRSFPRPKQAGTSR